MRLAPLVLAFLLVASAAEATSYFVDYSIGNDVNNGLSQTNQGGGVGPWKDPPGTTCGGTALGTCGTIGTGLGSTTGWHTLASGDTLSFNSGQTYPMAIIVDSTWYPAGGVTFGKYGSGSLPRIDGGGNPLTLPENTTGQWTNIDSTTWSTPFTCSRLQHSVSPFDWVQPLRSNNGGVNWYRWTKGGYVNGNPGPPGINMPGSNSGCTSGTLVVGGMFQDCANNRICVGVASGQNPNTDQWHISWRYAGFDVRQPNITIQNLDFWGKALVSQSTDFGGQVYGNPTLGNWSGLLVQNDTFEFSGADGVRVYESGSNTITNVKVLNNTIHDTYIYGIETLGSGTTQAPTSTGWVFQGNTINYNGDHGISVGVLNAPLLDHNTISYTGYGDTQCGVMTPGNHCSFGTDPTVSPPGGLAGYGDGIAIGARSGQANTSPTISNNTIFHAGEGCRLSNSAINNNCAGLNACLGACSSIYLENPQVSFTVYNNFVSYSWNAGITINNSGSVSMQATTGTIVNNSELNDWLAGLEDYNAGLPANKYTIQNNIFWSSTPRNGGNDGADFFWRSPVSQVSISNNSTAVLTTPKGNGYYCQPGGSGPSNYQTNPCDVSWANPLTSNPGYTTVTDPANLDLVGGSPSINSGLNTSSLGVTVDIHGTARPQPPGGAFDRGANEFIGGGATTTTPTPTSTIITNTTIAGPTTTVSPSTTIPVTSTTLPSGGTRSSLHGVRQKGIVKR